MRIDKFLSECGLASRKESAKAAKSGGITVNGAVVKDTSKHIDPEKDSVTFLGRAVEYHRFIYILLNKPEGYVSATEDKQHPFVTELLPEEYRKMGLFPVGRLDKDGVPYFSCNTVNIFLGSHTRIFSKFLNLLTVFVGTC